MPGRRIFRQIDGHQVRAHALTHAHPDHQGASKEVCERLAHSALVRARRRRGDGDAVSSGSSRHRSTGRSNGPGRARRIRSRGASRRATRSPASGSCTFPATRPATSPTGASPTACWCWATCSTTWTSRPAFAAFTSRRPSSRPIPRATASPPGGSRRSSPSLVCFGHGPPLRDTRGVRGLRAEAAAVAQTATMAASGAAAAATSRPSRTRTVRRAAGVGRRRPEARRLRRHPAEHRVENRNGPAIDAPQRIDDGARGRDRAGGPTRARPARREASGTAGSRRSRLQRSPRDLAQALRAGGRAQPGRDQHQQAGSRAASQRQRLTPMPPISAKTSTPAARNVAMATPAARRRGLPASATHARREPGGDRGQQRPGGARQQQAEGDRRRERDRARVESPPQRRSTGIGRPARAPLAPRFGRPPLQAAPVDEHLDDAGEGRPCEQS